MIEDRITVRPAPRRLGPSTGAAWCGVRYADHGATVSRQHPLVAIVGQVGAVFDGEHVYVEIIAPRKNPQGVRRVTIEEDRERRNQWQRDVRARLGRSDRQSGVTP